MALLRFLCFPSITNPSPKHQCHLTSLLNLQNCHCQSNYPVNKLSFCQQPSSFNPLCLLLSQTPCVGTKRNDNFVLKFASASQEQALDSSSANVSAENQSTEAETEEISRTRLLAQNVPWTSTPEDIRSLFEKHGKVLDVEVLICSSSFDVLLIYFICIQLLFVYLIVFVFVLVLKLSMYNKTRNRGLAFIEMGSPEEALEALKNLELYVSYCCSNVSFVSYKFVCNIFQHSQNDSLWNYGSSIVFQCRNAL